MTPASPDLRSPRTPTRPVESLRTLAQCGLGVFSRKGAGGRRCTNQHGFTYLGVLFFVVAFGLGLASVALVWHTAVQRDKETELLFVGKQYRQAIASYYSSGQREFPARLEDLLLDPRFPNVRRHLRRLYPDPMTGTSEWGLVKLGDRIVGIYSLAPGIPLKEVPSGSSDEPPIGGTSYSEWKFIVDPSTQGQAAVPPGSSVPQPMRPPGAVPMATDSQGQPAASDPCERDQDASITRCQGDDAGKDFQACVMEAFQQFQKCKGAG